MRVSFPTMQNPDCAHNCATANNKHSNMQNSSRIISFKNLFKNMQIEHSLKKEYGMNCNLGINGFVADCVKTTIKLFKELFGKDSLPNEVTYKSFDRLFGYDKDVLGLHEHYINGTNAVFFNSDNLCYQTKNKLKFHEMSQKFFWWHPTGNYLQTFVHEFAHSAHFKHLNSRGNADVMSELRETRIPTVLGRFITKFKLGRYSATNMNEFMAERITKDVCKNLDKNDRFIGDKKNLDYANIFLDKWKYRYSSPQAYLDYYTQQVWNGDKKKAEEIVDAMDGYLAKIEALDAAPVVVRLKEALPQKSVFAKLADWVYERNVGVTSLLDRLNELGVMRQRLEVME